MIEVSKIKKSLVFYRVMAYVVGVMLILLICVGLPLRYLSDNQQLEAIGATMNQVIGIAHGWLYMVLIAAAILLGRQVRWTWKWILGIALAGTVPFLSFVAEHFATKDVKRRLAKIDQYLEQRDGTGEPREATA